MFGLTFEKLFFVAIIAGFVLGPSRLPGYAHQLARSVRALRHFVETTRSAAERDMGIPLKRTEWESLNLRQYDPRRIVSDALHDTSTAAPVDPPKTVVTEKMNEEASRIRPGQKYLVSGTSSHPRRILIASLPEDDPRHVAARVGRTAHPAPRDPLPFESESVHATIRSVSSKGEHGEGKEGLGTDETEGDASQDSYLGVHGLDDFAGQAASDSPGLADDHRHFLGK